MSDRILTDDVVTRTEREAEDLVFLGKHTMDLCASHRLLAARVKELETELTELAQSMTHPLETS